MDGSHVFEKDARGALFQKLAAKGHPAHRGPKRHGAGLFQKHGNHVFEKAQSRGGGTPPPRHPEACLQAEGPS